MKWNRCDRLVRSLLLSMIVSFAGCSAPDSKSKLDIPSHWQNAKVNASALDTASLAQWWKRLNDPVLEELVRLAQTNSPDVRTAASRIAEARARGGLEVASLLPTVSGSTSGRTAHTKNKVTDTTNTSESWNAALDASWQVDLFGKQLQNVKAAKADWEQSIENYYALQVSIAADIAETYVALRAAERQLNVVYETLKTREETFQMTKWREQAGVGSGLDTLQSSSTLEQAKASIPALQQTIVQTKNQLTLLTGLMPGALDNLLKRKQSVPKVSGTIATGIPADVLRQRPDIRAAERGLQAAIARRKSVQLERLPSLNLSGSIGVDALKAGKLPSPETVAASVLGGLSAPIFDAGRIRENINIQNEKEKQAAIAYESAVLQALSEVQNALVSVERTAERLTILNRAVASAREAQTIALQQFEAGQADLLTVLDAQRTLLNLEEQQVTASANEVNAHIQLYKALGGGWSNR